VNNVYFQNIITNLEKTVVSIGREEKYLLYNDGINLLLKTFTSHKTAFSQLFFIGNGGSAAIASHMTADFMKNGGMRTYSLYDNAIMSCISNDYGYDQVFAKPLSMLGNPGDLLVAISSSGNSSNIVNAIRVAKEKQIFVITFTGFKPDNKSRTLGNLNVYVPCEEYGKVESIHQIILQQIVDMILLRDGLGI